MSKSRRKVWGLALSLLLLAGTGAEAAGKGATLAVFLPTALDDGQARFEFGETLAKELSKSLGHPVVARNFARYEDFSKALKTGKADYAVVDAFSATALSGEPVALAGRAGGATERWVIISAGRGSVKDLKGKRLAVARGSGAADLRFVDNVVFGGDLEAKKHFQLVQVPNVESALKALEAKSAEAALVPASLAPASSRVIYRSAPEPAVVVLQMKGDGAKLLAALREVGAVAPFQKFVPAPKGTLADFNRRVTRGIPARQPVLAESPTHRAETGAFLELGEVGLVLPSFAEDLEVEQVLPDD